MLRLLSCIILPGWNTKTYSGQDEHKETAIGYACRYGNRKTTKEYLSNTFIINNTIENMENIIKVKVFGDLAHKIEDGELFRAVVDSVEGRPVVTLESVIVREEID